MMLRSCAVVLCVLISIVVAINISYVRRDANVHLIVGSHRIVDDIIVIPSNRRLYLLAIVAVHESADFAGYECGGIDANGFVQLAALMQSIADVNRLGILPGIELGLIAIDSCSADVRTVADFYELLAGVEREAIVGVIRIDATSMPNFDALSRYFRMPTIGAYFGGPTVGADEQLRVATLPDARHIVVVMVEMLERMQVGCVSLVFDAGSYARMAMEFARSAEKQRICVDEKLAFAGGSPNIEVAQLAVRKLLLSEARIVVVFASERTCKSVGSYFA